MKYDNPWIDPRIEQLRPEDMQGYLLRRGWSPVAGPRAQVQLFEEPAAAGKRPIVQAIPLIERASDYLQSAIDLVTAIARLESRYAVEVLNDMLSTRGEVLPNGAGVTPRQTAS